MQKETQVIVLECLNAIKANPTILERMDISDEYFEEVIKKVEKENVEEQLINGFITDLVTIKTLMEQYNNRKIKFSTIWDFINVRLDVYNED